MKTASSPGKRLVMPAEWEPHLATWLAWPHHVGDWPGKFGPIPWVYCEIVRQLARSERVRLLVEGEPGERKARAALGRAAVPLEAVDFVRIPTDRVWARDYGPMFCLDAGGRPRIVDWRFTGWAKYPNHRRDDRVAAAAARHFALPRVEPLVDGERMVLEGGAIDVDGQGLLLTTEECLLSPIQERNPGFTRADYEAAFARFLGVKKVLWLGEGIVGDDTHGHVDDLARFVAPGVVVAAAEPDPRDPNHRRLADNLERLSRMTDLSGRPLTVVPLQMPGPVVFEGRRLPASYANFYVGNSVVLVPTFDDEKDRLALDTLARLFPGRRVVGIHAVDLVWGLGTLHCLSQQQPAPRARRR